MGVPLVLSALVPGVAEATHPDASYIVYMNRWGGEYVHGYPDDSRINRASALAVDRAVIPAYPHDVTWGRLVDCMRDVFADFDVYVTDEDPGDVEHFEVVVGGTGDDIGRPDVGGIAPSICVFAENAVVFAFAGASTDVDWLCWVSGQEVGHAFGLEHVTACDDLMTYQLDCSSRSYADIDAYCGEQASRTCWCTGSDTQNSHEILLDRLGPHPPILPPTVSIVSPEDGAVVAPGFPIDVVASDDREVSSVRLQIDGDDVDSDLDEPWAFVAPLDLADGPHEILVRAIDNEGAAGVDSITVTTSGGGDCAAPPCADAGAGDAGAEARRREYGCGCDQAPLAPAGAWLLAIAFGRRRKR